MSEVPLTILNALPQGLLELNATDLHTILSAPTLIHLQGEQEPPLFVSVLLHGNETTGWLAIQALLKKYQGRSLPRSLAIFIGNVAAARYRQRHLEDQPDYNRIWQAGDAPEQIMAQQVIADMRSRGVFASIDIHNNTGRNPHYGCITHLEPSHLNLARLFGEIVVYFTSPKTVQAAAFGDFCPAITLECGQPDQPEGTAHALSYIETCLALAEISNTPVTDIDIFHTVAIVKIPPEIDFSFGETNGNHQDIRFPRNMDCLNFCELPIGTKLGEVNSSHKSYLEAWSEAGEEVSDRFFAIVNGEILTKTPVMPSMLTLQPEIIRQDCLCYLMERYHLF